MAEFGVIVLAAGKSARMGQAKQLLPVLGQSLVQRAANVALGSGASEVLVVTGSEAAAVAENLANLSLKVILNPKWEDGMGTSISTGVAHVSDSLPCVVITVCDQPFVTSVHLMELASKANPISASSYGGVVGTPCAFARSEFPKLLNLAADQGARSIIRNGNPVIIPFNAARFDVDTPEDYESLLTQLRCRKVE